MWPSYSKVGADELAGEEFNPLGYEFFLFFFEEMMHD